LGQWHPAVHGDRSVVAVGIDLAVDIRHNVVVARDLHGSGHSRWVPGKDALAEDMENRIAVVVEENRMGHVEGDMEIHNLGFARGRIEVEENLRNLAVGGNNHPAAAAADRDRPGRRSLDSTYCIGKSFKLSLW